MSKNYYVYIITNSRRTLYIGFTNNLERRLEEHRSKAVDGYSARYNLSKLVYYETFSQVEDAIAHEKRLKGWTRQKKIELIERNNPFWRDMSDFTR